MDAAVHDIDADIERTDAFVARKRFLQLTDEILVFMIHALSSTARAKTVRGRLAGRREGEHAKVMPHAIQSPAANMQVGISRGALYVELRPSSATFLRPKLDIRAQDGPPPKRSA